MDPTPFSLVTPSKSGALPHPIPSRCRAFTLVELLVVLGIIAFLAAMLMPTIRRAHESANEITCTANRRQLMQAFHLFAVDHNQSLPGGHYDKSNPDPDCRDWLFGTQSNLLNAPEGGTIYRYLNSNNIFRCPSIPTAAVGSFAESNGHFDYSMFLSFTGARVTNVNGQARYEHAEGKFEPVPTPVICEEHPGYYMNTLSIDSSHASVDRMAIHHRNGCFYASIDGSVHWFAEPPDPSGTYRWSSLAPSKRWVHIGSDVYYGWWNGQ